MSEPVHVSMCRRCGTRCVVTYDEDGWYRVHLSVARTNIGVTVPEPFPSRRVAREYCTDYLANHTHGRKELLP